jgi:hypothetical protein
VERALLPAAFEVDFYFVEQPKKSEYKAAGKSARSTQSMIPGNPNCTLDSYLA